MSTTNLFFSPVLRGGRFDNHTLPLEFLKDLTVFEEMLLEIAKHEFRRNNKDRQRIPRNFGKDLELCISEIEPGSAVLKLGFVLATALSSANPNVQYYEQARDRFCCAVTEASEGKSVKNFIPDSAARHLEQFGRGLRDDESIDMSLPGGKKCVFTNQIRKVILSEFERTEFDEACEIRGYVPEMNRETQTCQIALCHEDNKITISYDRYESEVLAAFTAYRDKRLAVQISGTGVFSVRDNRLQRMKSINTILVLEPLDVSVQVDKLKMLKDGWLDGEGKAPLHEGLDWFVYAFDTHFGDSLPLPYIYPTYEGGIQLEWSHGSWELSLEIDLTFHTGYWHALDTENSQVDEKDLNLNEEEYWSFLTQQIQTKKHEHAI